MQALIDVIMALVTTALKALELRIHGSLGYFDRGDPGVWDFGIGDFVTDNAWHDLDLSDIVPVQAKAVSLKVNFRATAINRFIDVRKKGNVNEHTAIKIWTQVANVKLGTTRPVSISSHGLLEYRIWDNNVDFCNIIVCGWWER